MSLLQYFTDSFPRGPTTPVSGANSTTGVGNGWIDQNGGLYYITSNELAIVAGGTWNANWLLRSVSEKSINQRIVITTAAGTLNNNITAMLRVNPTSHNAYGIVLIPGGGLDFFTVTSGSWNYISNVSCPSSTTGYIIDVSAISNASLTSTTITALIYNAASPTTPIATSTNTDTTLALQSAGTYGITENLSSSVTPITNITLYNQPALSIIPTSASEYAPSSTVPITATLIASSAALSATLSGGGTLSTVTPTSGTAFTYTSPTTGSGTATVVVTDVLDGLTVTCIISYSPASLTLSPAVALVNAPSSVTSITPTQTGNYGSMTATVSGGGTLSTSTPTSGTAFTYTSPTSGSGTAIITVTDATNGIVSTTLIKYASDINTFRNIHYNLTAWASGTLITIRTRKSSNGHAWQALTAGTTGTTAPTLSGVITENAAYIIFFDGVVTWKWLSIIDYTTLQAWWNALPTPVTTAVTAYLWNNGTINIGSQELLASGGKTSSIYPATICPAPGDGFVDIAGVMPQGTILALMGGVNIAIASGKTFLNITASEVVNLVGLQLVVADASSSSTYVCKSTDNTPIVLTVAGCIIWANGYSGAATYIFALYTAASIFLINTVLTATGGQTTSILATGPASILIENCSFYQGSTATVSYLNSTSNTVTLRTTIFGVLATPITYTGSGSITSSHNAFGATLGTLAITDTGSIFTAAAYSSWANYSIASNNNSDARLTLGSPCYRTGTTPTYATSDIYGTVRTGGYDMGAFQAVMYTAAVANVHTNLSAWQPMTTVAIGQRVYSNYQVWQAATAGVTGFTAPAGTSNMSDGTISWNWVSSYDFVECATWYRLLPLTLTQPVSALFWNNGTITSQIIFSGPPVGAKGNGVNIITITCAPGESFVDYHTAHPSAALNISSTSGVYFTAAPYVAINDNFTISNIQIAVASGNVINYSYNYMYATFTNCIFSTPNTFTNNYYNGGGTYKSCLVIITGNSAITGSIMGNEIAITNCTFIALNSPAGLVVLSPAYTSPIVKNSLFIGFGTFGGSATITSSHNMISNATIGTVGSDTGSSFNAVASSLFVNPASDFRLLAGCPAFDAGITISGLTTDIFGTIRPQYAAYDIGCYEIPFTPAAQWPIITWLE